MKALVFREIGALDVLALEDVVVPEPEKGQVRVKIESIGLNRADSLFREDKYFIKPFAKPGIKPGIKPNMNQGAYSRVGFEGAGVVDAAPVGSKFSVGDRVAMLPLQFDVISQGCLAEYGVYQESSLIKTPEGIDPGIAGGVWMQYLTAWGGLVMDGQLRQGETLVVTAASSSVGIAAIQLGKMLGATVVATTTSDEKTPQLVEQGADYVINMKTEDYVARIKAITGSRGTDLVFDAVAGPATRFLVQGAARRSRIVIQGMLDRRPMDIHAGVLMKRLLTLKGFTVDALLESKDYFDKAVLDIANGLQSNQLTPLIADKFSLDDFRAAFELLESNKHVGKIIVNP